MGLPDLWRIALQAFWMTQETSVNIWELNTPERFWGCQPNPPQEIWREAIRLSLQSIGYTSPQSSLNDFLIMTLGESQFGPNHWDLGLKKRIYYQLKPLLPRSLISTLKKFNARATHDNFPLGWPAEDRYARFLRSVLERVADLWDGEKIAASPFWPGGKGFALVLTHDVETAQGQDFLYQVADLEESLGYRSSFNFVPERYKLDRTQIENLRVRGFEIGVHGLKHDGKLFGSQRAFSKRAERINHHLIDLGAAGFRSPLMHRNPFWMQALKMEYDLSFFDTDPYEPMPGGCMSIWPFFIGHFVELPYTLVQDCTLGLVLGEESPKIWVDKVSFLEKYQGMALLNSHPDYLRDRRIWKLYEEFLVQMKDKNNYWHALPKTVARWWRKRTNAQRG